MNKDCFFEKAKKKASYLFCLIFPLLFFSCGVFQRTVEVPKNDPPPVLKENKSKKKQEAEDVVLEKMDTLYWTDLNERPIGAPKVDTGFLEKYKIAVILPFFGEQFQTNTSDIQRKSHKAIQFYAGMKQALKDAEESQSQFEVKILDNNGDAKKTEALFEDDFVQEAQVIIGPFLSRNVSVVAEKVKETKQTFVSPYNAREQLTSENPYYIQVRPSLKTHVDKILNHLDKQGSRENITLIGQDSSESKYLVAYFQEGYINGVEDRDSLASCIFDAENYLVGEDTPPCLMGTFGEVKPLIIASTDERFVYAALRRIGVEADKTGVQYEIYGMPQWRNFENIGFDLFEKLKIKISAYDFVDEKAEEVITFRSSFRQTYGTTPDIEAYLGYDVMNYVKKMLSKYGTTFPQNMDVESMKGIHTGFNFTPKYPEGDDRFEKIEYYENSFINILKFKGYHYQLEE